MSRDNVMTVKTDEVFRQIGNLGIAADNRMVHLLYGCDLAGRVYFSKLYGRAVNRSWPLRLSMYYSRLWSRTERKHGSLSQVLGREGVSDASE